MGAKREPKLDTILAYEGMDSNEYLETISEWISDLDNISEAAIDAECDVDDFVGPTTKLSGAVLYDMLADHIELMIQVHIEHAMSECNWELMGKLFVELTKAAQLVEAESVTFNIPER